jgi:hypothetical protein
MIEKPAIIVTSLGRTGTKFFHTLFQEAVSDGTSLHEPDVLNVVQYEGTGERVRQFLKQVREAGAYNLIVRKALGRWSLVELSDARVRGTLSYAEAVRRVLSQRGEFVRSRPGAVYVEASIGYYGLIDVLRDVYRHCRVVYVIRDGRDWVRSHMNWGQMYGKGKIRSLIAHTWPAACEIPDDPYRARWQSLSRFERICWAWVRLNGYALGTVEESPYASVFRFEDVFHSEDRYRHLADLVRFATALPYVAQFATSSLEGWLDRQIHTSSPQFPSWEGWSMEQRQQFETICGPLMRELNYA